MRYLIILVFALSCNYSEPKQPENNMQAPVVDTVATVADSSAYIVNDVK